MNSQILKRSLKSDCHIKWHEVNVALNMHYLRSTLKNVDLCSTKTVVTSNHFFLCSFRSTKNFRKKYNLELTAATFLIIDYNEESMDIACEWQRCIGDTINLVSPLRCGAGGLGGGGRSEN